MYEIYIIRIFFIHFSVAEAMVSVYEHKIFKKVVTVSFYIPPPEPEPLGPQRTVEMRGINPDFQDMYELYFSNPDKGGGHIQNSELSDDGSVLYITFICPEGK